MLYRAVIAGTGAVVPERILTNRDLESMVDTSDEWIRTRTGIAERRIAGLGENVSDMAATAGRLAMDNAGVRASDLDLIVVATSSPDTIMPSAACITQSKIGAACPAFDVMAACSGFVFGLAACAAFIETGAYETVLLIGSDALTRHVDWSDRSTCVLFGDGAGAVVLRRSSGDSGVLASYLASDGRGADLLKIPAGGSANPGSESTVSEGQHFIKMQGHEIFKFAVRAIPDAVKKALEMSGLSIDDVSYIVPHQANRRIIDAAAERLGIDSNRMVSNIERYGNTSTASIPIALHELEGQGKLNEGDILVFVGFGAGLTWGANVVRWGKGVDR